MRRNVMLKRVENGLKMVGVNLSRKPFIKWVDFNKMLIEEDAQRQEDDEFIDQLEIKLSTLNKILEHRLQSLSFAHLHQACIHT